MHFLLLILIAPFVLLVALIGLSFLLLAASLALEFPLVLVPATALGLLGHYLMTLDSKQGVPCRQN